MALTVFTVVPAISSEGNEWEDLVLWRALEHGANLQQVHRVVSCESKFWPFSTNKSSSATGLYQWLPGRGNAWDNTPAYKELGMDIVTLYRRGDPDAPFYDADMGAWMFAHGYSFHWSCK